MARINLLPWRDELRKEKQRQFIFTAVGAGVLAGLVVALVHMQYQGMIDHQKSRNQFLDGQIKVLDKRIEKIKELESTKANLLARMNVIQQLQTDRPLSVRLLDEVVRTLPDGVYLNKLEQKGSGLSVSGEAESNARVAAYMRNIDASTWIGNPKLDVIDTKRTERSRSSAFTLRASQLKQKPADELAEGDS